MSVRTVSGRAYEENFASRPRCACALRRKADAEEVGAIL